VDVDTGVRRGLVVKYSGLDCGAIQLEPAKFGLSEEMASWSARLPSTAKGVSAIEAERIARNAEPDRSTVPAAWAGEFLNDCAVHKDSLGAQPK
jgi:hypothetical protein